MKMNLGFAALVAILLAGCIKNNYELTLTPAGDRIE